MFPLKTFVVAIILAMAFTPRVNACPAHNHEQVVEAPAPTSAEAASSLASATSGTTTTVDAAAPAEMASADQGSKPAAN